MYFVSWYLHNKENDGWAYKIEGKYASLDSAKKAYYTLLGNRIMGEFWQAPQPEPNEEE